MCHPVLYSDLIILCPSALNNLPSQIGSRLEKKIDNLIGAEDDLDTAHGLTFYWDVNLPCSYGKNVVIVYSYTL